jgi:Lantibiotic dehydratase, N terminus
MWSRPEFVVGIEQASPTLAERVAAVLAGQPVDQRQVSRAALATTRYLLRATGRPTPFGLFAGVARVRLAGETRVRWGSRHQSVARADTQWLADVIDQLEAYPALLGRLDVVLTSLATRRGDRLEAPRPGGWVSIGYSPAVRAVCELAAHPVRFSELAGRLAIAVPGGSQPAAEVMLTTLLRHRLLISELRAPFTTTDPLGYLAACLHDQRQLNELRDATLCHGWAGLLLTVWRTAADASNPDRFPLRALGVRLQEHLDRHGQPAGDGLLEGAAGVQLVKHTVAAAEPLGPGWDSCLLLTDASPARPPVGRRPRSALSEQLAQGDR